MKQTFYSDTELLEGLSKGSDTAIALLYRHYFPVLSKWMITKGALESDIEDVFQDALMVLYAKSKDTAFCLTCKLSTYLFAVSKRIWYKKLEQQRNAPLVSEESILEQQSEWINTEADLDAFMEKEAQLELLQTALEKLGQPCRDLLAAFYTKEMNMKAIAEAFNYTSPDNAKTQKYKCLNRLRKIYFNQTVKTATRS